MWPAGLLRALWLKWSRGALVLFISGLAAGLFLIGALFAIELLGAVVSSPQMPDSYVTAQKVRWLKLSAIVWLPLAIGWVLPMVGSMIAEWDAEDAEAARSVEHLPKLVRAVLFALALAIIPVTILYGILSGWGIGTWMAAWTISAVISLCAFQWAAPSDLKKQGATGMHDKESATKRINSLQNPLDP